jgi:hypothetical protein
MGVKLGLHVEGEHRLLRTICGPDRYEVTRGWRKVNNEDLHSLSLNIRY